MMQGHEEQGHEVTTTLSLWPAGAVRESEGRGWEDDHRCKDLLLSRILRATSCTLEQGLGTGTGDLAKGALDRGLGRVSGWRTGRTFLVFRFLMRIYAFFSSVNRRGLHANGFPRTMSHHGKAPGSDGVDMDRASQREADGNQVIRVIGMTVVTTQVICQYHIFTLHIVQVEAIGGKAFEQALDACGGRLGLSFHYLGNCCMVNHSIELMVSDYAFP